MSNPVNVDFITKVVEVEVNDTQKESLAAVAAVASARKATEKASAAAASATNAANSYAQADAVATSLTDIYNEAIAEGTVVAPAIDTTLSISGAAADAKQTGNAVRSSYVTKTDETLWIYGTVTASSGAMYDSGDSYTKRMKVVFIPDSICGFRITNTYKYQVFAYQADGTYVGAWQGSSFAKSLNWINSNGNEVFFRQFNPAYFYVLVVSLIEESALDLDVDTLAVTFIYKTAESLAKAGVSADADKVGCVTEAIYSHNLADGVAFHDKYVVKYDTGNNNVVTGDFAVSDYIDVSAYESIYYTRLQSTSETPISGTAFYDTNKEYVSGIRTVSGSAVDYKLVKVKIPSGVKYAKFSYVSKNSTDFSQQTFAVYDAVAYEKSLVFNAQKITEVPLYPEGLDRGTGSPILTHDTFWSYRTTDLISVNGETTIQANQEDIDSSLFFNIYEYAEATEDNITYVGALRELQFVNGSYVYTPSTSSVKYIRVGFILALPEDLPETPNMSKFHDLVLYSLGGNEIRKNPNITDSGGRIKFVYTVDGDTYTSGQILLPPNYSIRGKSVPLAVFLHGTNGMNYWTEAIGSTDTEAGVRYLLDYLTDEGFAVFDCYCFTSKYYSTSSQNQACPLPIYLQAYESGIRYICEHYNVDINNVCYFAKSAGGNIAHMILHNCGSIKPRAMGMLAPSTGFASTIFNSFFLQSSQRAIVVDWLGLSNEEGASHFISNGHLNDAETKAFVDDHLDSFAGLICCAIGVNGSTFEDQYTWMTTGTSTLPQWMADKDIPSIPAGWSSGNAIGAPTLINHPNLSAYSPIPVKWWQAFDDVNVSGHANYTVYTWLKNGGTNVQWRTMPNGTGGHSSVDTSETALTSSGTTRLGIAYTDIATAYVEMVDFFYQNMSQ